MKLFFIVFLVLLFIPSLGAARQPVIPLVDISQFCSDNSRVIGNIPRPAIGDELYIARVEFSQVEFPVLQIRNDSLNKAAVVDILAIHLGEANSKRHIIKITPGQMYLLSLKSLEFDYNAFILTSLQPFTASIRDNISGKRFFAHRDDLIYSPPAFTEEEYEKIRCEDSISREGNFKPTDSAIGNSRESAAGIITCSGSWHLFCMSHEVCGDYNIRDYGKVVETICDGNTHYLVYWRYNEPTRRFPGDICYASYYTIGANGDHVQWWGSDGQCPWLATSFSSGSYYVVLFE